MYFHLQDDDSKMRYSFQTLNGCHEKKIFFSFYMKNTTMLHFTYGKYQLQMYIKISPYLYPLSLNNADQKNILSRSKR